MHLLLAVLASFSTLYAATNEAVTSLDLYPYTILKVRVADNGGKRLIIASSYEGTILAVDPTGQVLWKNALSGVMNHDIWCDDLTGDDQDEVLAANADGSIYCLDSAGQLLWRFRPNNAPMYSVCTVHNGNNTWVVAGGFDKNLYYLSSAGRLIKTVPSSKYSREKTWGKGPERVPPSGVHTVNFVRPFRGPGGKQYLVLHGVVRSIGAAGSLYIFSLPKERPELVIPLPKGMAYGELRVADLDNDAQDELLLGTSGSFDKSALVICRPFQKQVKTVVLAEQQWRRQIDRFGYRVLQPEFVEQAGSLVALFGSRLILIPAPIHAPNKAKVLACRYSFNDIWQDRKTGKLILASSQSGGSCIHVLDTNIPGWEQAYQHLEPAGKIATILENTSWVREKLKQLEQLRCVREPLPVYFMTESIPDDLSPLVTRLQEEAPWLVFLRGVHLPEAENWDRSQMASRKYRNRRDRRKHYSATSDEIVTKITRALQDAPGVAYWGGHGNDPYMISLQTEKRILDAAGNKLVVIIFPELEDASDEFAFVLKDLLYPLAEYCRKRNGKLFIRSKHLFWQTTIYHPMWQRFLRGEFSDVFIPAMEETTDKSMELSLAARLGLWATGVVDDWGTRCARDNASFDRLRQFSHQMLPNHFLRTQIYHLSLGARYLNNFPVDQHYISVLWELLAKGIIYVPKREEILSFSPVHISIINPDKHVCEDGNNVKWTTFFDPISDAANSFVFSRLNGTWPGAPVTAWDFSRYAAGVIDRRQNFLPPYPNGIVLITPHSQQHNKRLRENLHPLYRGILREYITDGRYYYSSDLSQRYPANTYYRTIAADITASAQHLPLTVSGDVAWVAAACGPRRIRLTLIDSGYLNPQDRTAVIRFHAIKPARITDLLTHRTVTTDNQNRVRVKVPCGLFRLLEVETQTPICN